MEKKKFFLSLLFMFVAGVLDAYTYLVRGGVFAAMQTGNLIYLCINLVKGNFGILYKYIFSILAFCTGILLFHFIKEKKYGLHISAGVLVACYAIGFLMPAGDLNFISIVFFSFGIAVQLQLVRNIGPFTIANNMCTGNLRSLTECIGLFITSKDKKYKTGIIIYSSLIVSFMLGVIIAAVLIL